jgi:hypothetical protein
VVIYKLSDIVGKPLAKDRKAFGVVNDLKEKLTFKILAFPVFDINGQLIENTLKSNSYIVPKFFVCCSKYYGPNSDKKRFFFSVDGVVLRTFSSK